MKHPIETKDDPLVKNLYQAATKAHQFIIGKKNKKRRMDITVELENALAALRKVYDWPTRIIG